MRDPIKDKYTKKPLSRQRKWQLRHPEQIKAINARYDASEKGKERKRRWREKHKAEHYLDPNVVEALDPDFIAPHLDPDELNNGKGGDIDFKRPF